MNAKNKSVCGNINSGESVVKKDGYKNYYYYEVSP